MNQLKLNQEEKMTNPVQLLYPVEQMSKSHKLGQLKSQARDKDLPSTPTFSIQQNRAK